MRTEQAFRKGVENQGKESMVFDWIKAAKLIKKASCQYAEAGLQSDWEWTGGTIFEDGKPMPKDDTYTYLASTWAIPEIEINGVKSDCFKMASELPGWDAKTYWPKEALEILNGGGKTDDRNNRPTN